MREKTERNKEIVRRIKQGEYQVDIARHFNITPAMVTRIKKRYLNGRQISQIKRLQRK